MVFDFLFFILNPFAKQEAKISSIDEIQRIILKNITSEVEKMPVIVPNVGGCYKLSGNNFIEVSESDRTYIIYFSDKLTPLAPNNQVGCATPYTFGASANENLIIRKDIEKLVEDYNNDYSKLKNSLGITDEFSFKFRYFNKSKIQELSVEKEHPTRVEVEAKEYPVRVLGDTGVEELILNLMAWR